jgi:2-isopropylmalate synthase
VALKLRRPFRAAAHLPELTALSRFVSEVCNLPPAPGAPYVGRNAFAHKGGIHVSAILRNTATYEHVPPEAVGNSREVVVSELAGGSNLEYKFRDLGLDWVTPEGRRLVLARIKDLEFEGYQFEGAEASFELLARRVLHRLRPFFETVGYSVAVARRSGPAAEVEATVKVSVGGRVFHTAADGDGPVNALDRALRRALDDPYPEIRDMRLADYKVRVIDGREGTASRVRVLIGTDSPAGYWTTVGVSDNILDASWKALCDSFDFGLLRMRMGVGEAGGAEGAGSPRAESGPAGSEVEAGA